MRARSCRRAANYVFGESPGPRRESVHDEAPIIAPAL
jgi:hypothetical protein